LGLADLLLVAIALQEMAVGDSPAVIVGYLALLFLSSLGELYFPDIMNINSFPCKANWFFLASAIGNFIVGPLIPTTQTWSETPVWKAAVPALVDIASQVFILGGIALSSSQTKSILYNSCIVWSALLSKFILKKMLTAGQWLGVVTLLAGLLIKARPSGIVGSGASTIILGMISISIGCALHSLVCVLNEYYIREYKFPAPKLCSLIGFYSIACWLLLFACGFIIPELQGDTWIYSRTNFGIDHMQNRSDETPMANLSAWVGFVLSSALHALAFFNLLGSLGVVSCGVMKGMTTAGYVTISAIFLCDAASPVKQRNCMTSITGASSSVSVLGVLIYTHFSKKALTDKGAREWKAGKEDNNSKKIMLVDVEEGDMPHGSGHSMNINTDSTDSN